MKMIKIPRNQDYQWICVKARDLGEILQINVEFDFENPQKLFGTGTSSVKSY